MIKKLAYISIIASFIGKSALSIELGPFDLTIFRIIIISILLLLYAHIMVRGKIRIRVHTNNKYSIVFFLLWLTYAMITLAWVKDYLSWIRAIYFIALGVLCIVTYINIFNTTKDVLAAFRLMSAMAAVHNAIGWYEITTGNYPFLDTERILKYSEWGIRYQLFAILMTLQLSCYFLFLSLMYVLLMPREKVKVVLHCCYGFFKLYGISSLIKG